MTDLAIILQLVFLEGVLSLDNAAVIGAMASRLPQNLPIPWPEWFQGPGRRLSRVLGPQQSAALKVGLLGAYLGRALMLLLASWVVDNVWLQVVGALYLVKLAAAELGTGRAGHEAHVPVVEGLGAETFWRVVVAIELADLAFSLDNVVAAIALSKDLRVVLLGVALGIVLMRFAAGIFAHLVRRQPVLEAAAYVLVLVIGLNLLVEALAGVHIPEALKIVSSFGTLALALVYGNSPLTRRLAWPLVAAARLVLRLTDRAMELVVRPAGALAWGLLHLVATARGRSEPV